MVEALCSLCGQHVGGFGIGRPLAWQCPECRKVFCGVSMSDTGAKTRCTVDYYMAGRIFKKPMCPVCKIEMREYAAPPQVKSR